MPAIAPDGSHDQHSAKVLHNLGYCDLLAGDIPSALQLFNAAADAYRLSAPGILPILAMDKARLMLAAGLAGDAGRELDGAMAAFRRQRLDHDLAEAELARAEAALGVGEPTVADHWAGSAARHFRRTVTTPAPASRNSPGCGPGSARRAVRRPRPPKRCGSPSGCASAG